MGIRLKLFVTALGVVAFIFGAYGVFDLLDTSIPLRLRLAESVYSSIQFFTITFPDYLVFQDEYRMNWPLQLARFLAPLVTVTAAISLFSFALEKWIKRLRVKYFYRGHAVIFGFNLRARMICEDLIRRRIRVILADPDLKVEDFEWLRKTGTIGFGISGAEGSAAELCKVEKANYIFAVHNEDSLNLKILVRAYQRNKEVFGTSASAEKAKQAATINTRCFVHFSEQSYKNLKFGSQFSDLDDFFDLQIFSVYERSAQLLTRSIYMKYAKDILKGPRMRIILFGTGKTGQAILEQLVRMSFFRRNRSASISVIDNKSDGWKQLKARFPAFTLGDKYYKAADQKRIRILKSQIGFPEIEFNEMPCYGAPLLTGQAIDHESDVEEITIAILSSSDATENLTIADALLQQKRVPIREIFVRSEETHSEIRRYVRSELERKNLSGFPTLEEICQLNAIEEESTEVLARTIHEEYLKGIEAVSGSQPSLEEWSKLDETFKESNRRAASHLEIKCSLLGHAYLNLDDADSVKKVAKEIKDQLADESVDSYLETLAECEHSRWSIEKLLDGWIPGSVRNDARKEHPNLVPWEISGSELEEAFSGFKSLSESDKQKDRNNIEKIPDLLEDLAAKYAETK